MRKSKKVFSIFSIFMCMSLLTPTIAFAKNITNIEKSNISSDESVLIANDGNTKYYVTNDELIKVKVTKLPHIKHYNSYGMESEGISEEGELTITNSYDIEFFTKDINQQERSDLLSPVTESVSLTRQDQALTSDGSIRATLSVGYSNSAGGISGLHLCKATGTYTHLSYQSGIVAQSSTLYYTASGKVYSNGAFLKNGTIGFTKSYGPSFSNIQLMPEGTCLPYSSLIYSAVVYTLNCSRGVTVEVPMTW